LIRVEVITCYISVVFETQCSVYSSEAKGFGEIPMWDRYRLGRKTRLSINSSLYLGNDMIQVRNMVTIER